MIPRHQLPGPGPGINRLFVLDVGITRIGRAYECEIWLDHPLLSLFHAQIERTDSGITLTDLESQRGTRVNNEPIPTNTAIPLKSGDVILIHPFILAYTSMVVHEALKALPPELLVGDGGAGSAAANSLDSDGLEQPPPPSALLPSAILTGPPPPFDYAAHMPPGLSRRSIRYVNYLPAIYRSDFVSRFLGMLEAILMPAEWNIANMDLRLDPRTAPAEFLPWLASWFDLVFDATWTEAMQRTFLIEAHNLFAMRGTKWALTRVLEIYTGRAPEIVDLTDRTNPYLFTVKIPFRERNVNREGVDRIIMADKPAHTTYKLEFRSERDVDLDDVFYEMEKGGD